MEAPRLFVLTPPGETPAVGVLPGFGVVTLIVKLTFVGQQVVSNPLDANDFAPPRAVPQVSIDGEVVEAPRGLPLGETLDLGPRGAFPLPAVEPKVTLCDSDLGAALSVAMICDTLAIQEGELVLTWRGEVEQGALATRDRLQVILQKELGEPARAQLSFAQTPEGVDADADLLALEQMALADRTPEPAIPVETYAAISAELAEQREPRAEILARHGLDERIWSLEERAWLEKMGRAAMEGDASAAVAYSEHFVAAQDAFGSSDDLDSMIHEYVAVTVELERSDDPLAVLQRWSLSLAQWMRLDRHWSRRAEADERLKSEIEHMLSVERARSEASE